MNKIQVYICIFSVFIYCLCITMIVVYLTVFVIRQQPAYTCIWPYMNRSTIFCCISNMHRFFFLALDTLSADVYSISLCETVVGISLRINVWARRMNTKFITLTNECGAISLVKNCVNCVRMCAENRLTWFIHFICCFQFETEKMRQWTIFCRKKRIEDIFSFIFMVKSVGIRPDSNLLNKEIYFIRRACKIGFEFGWNRNIVWEIQD